MNDTLPRLSAALADRYRLERELGAGGTAALADRYRIERELGGGNRCAARSAPPLYDLRGEPRHQHLLTRTGPTGAPKL